MPANEETDVTAITSRTLLEMARRYSPDAPLVRRDAHAKAHGCAKAVFHVGEALAPELAVGLFAKSGAAFKAWIRFSNGAFEPGPDTGMDGRGMAVKILAVAPGENAAPDTPAHDILMINYPVFFSGSAGDYRDFAEAGALTGASDGLKRYFMPSWNPMTWRIRQGLIAYRIASAEVTSPLSIRYFSMAPFAFGENRAVKYSAQPCAGGPAPATAGEQGAGYLRVALSSSLERGPACFDLLVQERKDGMPIEDVTRDWSETVSPYRRVASIELLRQGVTDVRKDALCENLSFSPWNAPPDHRPLGGINRLRKSVYDAISKYRHERNGVSVPDASQEWDRF